MCNALKDKHPNWYVFLYQMKHKVRVYVWYQ